MIRLPPGCKVSQEIRIIIDEITPEIKDWFDLIGGTTKTITVPARRTFVDVPVVQYGNAKPSYKMQDGTGNYLIRFHGDDASTASVFILKFIDNIQQHNLTQMETYVY